MIPNIFKTFSYLAACYEPKNKAKVISNLREVTFLYGANKRETDEKMNFWINLFNHFQKEINKKSNLLHKF